MAGNRSRVPAAIGRAQRAHRGHGPSTSTSPSGPTTTRPDGDRGRCAARSAPATPPTRRTAHSRKSRMDHTHPRTAAGAAGAGLLGGGRTRPHRRAARRRRAGPPGELFTAAGVTLRRAVLKTQTTGRVWAEDPDSGRRRDLSFEEHRGFWTWAVVEVLRHTGIRIEELTELSHHSLIQYRLPATGELIPLLQITPSKTDTERLLVIAPDLADVLSTIVARIRGDRPDVPLVVSYDKNERVYNPPMPLLFQWRRRLDNRAGLRNRAARLPRPRAHRDRRQRRRRPPDALHLPRLSQAVHHRRDPARHAATHRPTRRRPPRHQHHHGIQGRLPRRGDQRPPRLHRPPPRPAPQPRNTAPPPTRNGPSSSATSNAARSPSVTAAAPTTPPASTNTVVSAARCCVPTPPPGPASNRSATTSSPASPKPNPTAGTARPRA